MRKIFVVGSGLGYANWMQGDIVSHMEDADLVVFTGGEDVSPKLYDEPIGKFTYFNWHRDVHERNEWQRATELGKHIIGICRGSQLSCVLSGGRLVQHQENPNYIHDITTREGKAFPISSTHHQAQYPYDMDKDAYSIQALALPRQSDIHLDGNGKEMLDKYGEVEICYYPKTKALGIQGHPEMMWRERWRYKETFAYLHGLLDNHLNNTI